MTIFEGLRVMNMLHLEETDLPYTVPAGRVALAQFQKISIGSDPGSRTVTVGEASILVGGGSTYSFNAASLAVDDPAAALARGLLLFENQTITKVGSSTFVIDAVIVEDEKVTG